MENNPTGKSQWEYNGTTISQGDIDSVWKEYRSGKTKEWTVIKETKDLQVYRKPANRNFTFKAYMHFDNMPTEIVYALSADLTVRKHWDPVYLKVEEVEALDSEADIIYTQLKTPAPVADRDSCLLRVIKMSPPQYPSPDPLFENKTFLVVCRTTTHQKCPKTSQFVRVTAPIHAYLIEQDPNRTNGCCMFVISEHDMGGKIPQWVINIIAARSPVQWYTSVKAVSRRVYDNVRRSSADLEKVMAPQQSTNQITETISKQRGFNNFIKSKL
jgi:hypothetical protein